MHSIKTLTKTFELNAPGEDASSLAKEVWACIPSNVAEYASDREDDMEEIDAALRDEHTDIDIIARCLGGMGSLWPLTIHQRLAPHWTPEPITLICVDGELSYCSLPSLRRRFQLIEDYFTDHPNERSITLSCTKKEMRVCMMEAYCCRLAETHNALSYLNPKNNLYALHCDLAGTSISVLQQFTSRLSTEERASLVSYAEKNGYRLPSEEGVYILGTLPSVRCRRDVMATLYRERYPSFLFSVLSFLDLCEGKQEIVDLLLCGFEADKEEMPELTPEDAVRKQVRTAVKRVLRIMDLDIDVSIALARMAGLVLPGVLDPIPCLPYGVSPRATEKQQARLACSVICNEWDMIKYDSDEHPSIPALKRMKS